MKSVPEINHYVLYCIYPRSFCWVLSIIIISQRPWEVFSAYASFISVILCTCLVQVVLEKACCFLAVVLEHIGMVAVVYCDTLMKCINHLMRSEAERLLRL